MATAVFCQRLLRIQQFISRSRRGLIWVRSGHDQAEADAESLDNSAEASQPRNAPKLPYRVSYNPALYHHRVIARAALRKKENNEDEEYSVGSSQRLRSTKTTLVDLENEDPEDESPDHRDPNQPDMRAFLKCRPEYEHMSLDLTQRPSPAPIQESWALLQKVEVVSMTPSDVSRIIWELRCVDQDEKKPLMGDSRFTMLIRYSVENLKLFSLSQLLEVLQAFVWLDLRSPQRLLNHFELEFSRRAGQMTLHQLLFVADLWRCIWKKVPVFRERLYASVRLHMGQICPPELVQLLYIIGEGRHCPAHLVQPIELLLMRHLNQLQPEEVAVVALALFKSRTSLSDRAVMCIVDKALSFVEDMSDFGLVNVMKYLRFKFLSHEGWLKAMGREVPKRADRMGIQGLMHMALTCAALHHRNDDILLEIAERVPLLMPQCRSKDHAKLLWVFGTFGFLPDEYPTLYSSLIEGVRQCKADYRQFPQHLLTALLALSFVSTFPEDLFTLALSPEFVDLALKEPSMDLRKDLCTVDGAVGLELPDWSGPRLGSKVKEENSKMVWDFIEAEVCKKPEVMEAEKYLIDLLGGEEFVLKRMILPHTRSLDFEVHLDPEGRPLPVVLPETTPAKSQTPFSWNKGVTLTNGLLDQLVNNKRTKATPEVKHPGIHSLKLDEGKKLIHSGLSQTNGPSETLTKRTMNKTNKGPVKLAIQVCLLNHYCRHSDQMLGFYAMKRKHLKLAGYKVIELHSQEWVPLLRESRAQKLAYLHCKVFTH